MVNIKFTFKIVSSQYSVSEKPKDQMSELVSKRHPYTFYIKIYRYGLHKADDVLPFQEIKSRN